MQTFLEWFRSNQWAVAGFGVVSAAIIAAVSACVVAIVNAYAASRRDRTNVRREYHRTILQPFLNRIDGDIIAASAVMDMLSGLIPPSHGSATAQFDHDAFLRLTERITSYDVASPIPRVPPMIENLKVRDRSLADCLYQVTIAQIDFKVAAKRFAQENAVEAATSRPQRPAGVASEKQKTLFAEARRFANACIALRQRVEKIMPR
jgi:hypothetical protein